MSVDYNDIVKDGLVKVKGKLFGMWKQKYLVLRLPSSRGPARLDKFKDIETADFQIENNKSFIPLTDFNDVTQLSMTTSKHVIEISFKYRNSFHFSVDSDVEADFWKTAIYDVIRKVNEKSERGLFHVYLLPTPNLIAHGECIMQVTPEEICIFDPIQWQKLIVRWPLCALRRYGAHGTSFTIESGRRCETSEGIFMFNTSEGEKIYEAVHRSSLAVALLFRNPSLPTNIGFMPQQPTTPETTSLPGSRRYSDVPPSNYVNELPRRANTSDYRRPLPPPPVPGR